MSTATPVLDVSDTAKVPFSRLVAVELRKTYDTRAGFWLLATIVGLVLVTETIALIVTVVQDEEMIYGDFVGAAAFVTSIFLPVLGIMLVTSEWSQRTAMVTFALEPRRPLIIAAKALTGVILTFVTAAAALVIGAICNLLYSILQGGGDWELGWNFLIGFLITQVVAMLGGFALATLLLNTPAAIVVFFIYKWVLPGLFALGSALMDWFADLAPWIDFQAAQGPLFELAVDTGEEWGHLITSGLLWLVLPIALGLRRILRAEVK